MFNLGGEGGEGDAENEGRKRRESLSIFCLDFISCLDFNLSRETYFATIIYNENQCVFKLGGEGGGGDAENEGDEGVDSEVQGGVGGHGEEEEEDDDDDEEEEEEEEE